MKAVNVDAGFNSLASSADMMTLGLSPDGWAMVPLVGAVCVVAVLFSFWAMRRLREQHARADTLARDLEQDREHAREETRRRLGFLNAVSHDLRTPLNGVTLQTHVIEHAAQVGDEAAIRRAVEEIRASSATAAEILDSLLQYAQTELNENVISSCKVKELISQTADPFRAACEEKGVGFVISAPGDLMIQTDVAKLQRIVGNLLDNAVKFTAHGMVKVQVTTETCNGNGRRMIVEVVDTGGGVLPEHREKLFREFFQANNPSRDPRLGLGLGLVVARRLAGHLGGTLECRNGTARGATFRLELPV